MREIVHADNSIWVEIAVFVLGGGAYGLMEILFRGHTHWTMLVTGGACVLTLFYLREWLLVQPLAVEDLPPFQYCMYNKNQMIYASSHRFFQHYSIIPDTLIHCGDPVINHTLVASLENCASFVPSYFIGRIPSDTLRKLIFYAIDVPELSWELRVLYRRDSALGIFAREMIRLVRETPWRPLL